MNRGGVTRSGGPVRADVGIVVVSHSRALAQAAVALAAQMQAGRPVRVAVAAGLDETTLGTDATRIRDAIAEVDGPDGVVVLMDLGSAVLSAESALEGVQHPVWFSNAPLVEGAILAAVEAAAGSDLQRTAAAAERARELQKTGG